MGLVKPIYIIYLIIFVLSINIRASDLSEYTIGRLRNDVEYLCSPDLAGRDVPGITGDKAAIWLAEQFNAIGLHPAVGDSSFIQLVPIKVGWLDTVRTRVNLVIAGEVRALYWGRDFYTFPRTPVPIQFNWKLGFYGYGIDRSDDGASDYSTVVTDEGAMVLDGIGELDAKTNARWRISAFKAAAAKRAGLKALVIVAGERVGSQWPPTEAVGKLDRINRLIAGLPHDTPDLPIIWLNSQTLSDVIPLKDAPLGPAELKTTLEKVADDIHLNLSLEFKNDSTAHGYNIIGKIFGERDEWVMLGAHYDHEGLAPGTLRGYYPGADDNASGVAAMLEVCRRWAKAPRPKRGLLAVGFTAEEDGMLGSRWLANHPVVPSERIMAMVNLDMIGGVGFPSMEQARDPIAKPDTSFAAVYFSAASPRLKDVLTGAGDGVWLNLSYIPANELNFSDAGAFNNIGIPAMHLFSGFNPRYTTIDDTPESLSFDKLSKLTIFVDRLLHNLASEPGQIGFDPTLRVKPSRMGY